MGVGKPVHCTGAPVDLGICKRPGATRDVQQLSIVLFPRCVASLWIRPGRKVSADEVGRRIIIWFGRRRPLIAM